MRHNATFHPTARNALAHKVMARALALIMLAALLFSMAPARPVAAQLPVVNLLNYGRSISGTVDSPTGTELFFSGCIGETLDLTVEADGFSPRVQLFALEDDEAIASAVAASGANTISLGDITLTQSGVYIVVVSGRSRADRGDFNLTVNASGPNNPSPDDVYILNMLYGESVDGVIEPDLNEQWNFHGCVGDEIVVEVTTDGFVPQVKLNLPFAELPIAIADVEATGDSATAILRHTLPVNDAYNLIISGASESDQGSYTLSLEVENRRGVAPAPPTGTTPTVTVEATPTPTPNVEDAVTPTPSGPRGRRGLPTRTSSTPEATPAVTTTATRRSSTPTATPTPTPEFIMPGIGESAFTVIDIRSGGPINHAAYSPDGALIATAGEDGVVRVWAISDHEELQTLEGHEARVNYVAFAPDDSLIASAGDDGTVRLWDQLGRQSALLEMPDSRVTSVEFSPDSTLLVAATADGAVLVWDVAEGSILHELEGHQAPVYHARFSPDGSLIATGDGRGVVRLWLADDGQLLDVLPVNAAPGGGDPILSIAFSSDSTVIVVGGVTGVNQGSVQVWDTLTGDLIGELVGHREGGSIAAVSPDDAYIISGGRTEPGEDGNVEASARIWGTQDGSLAVAFVGYPSSVIAATFSPDGDEILTSDGSYLYLWPEAMIEALTAAFTDPVGVQVPTESEPPITVTATPAVTRTGQPTPTQLPTETPVPAQTPTLTPTPTPFLPLTQLEIFCTVMTDRLNLRPGPGTNFNPPIDVLELGDLVVVIGRNANSTWLQVAVLDDNLNVEHTGWVSAEFLFCVGEIGDAPVVEVGQ